MKKLMAICLCAIMLIGLMPAKVDAAGTGIVWNEENIMKAYRIRKNNQFYMFIVASDTYDTVIFLDSVELDHGSRKLYLYNNESTGEYELRVASGDVMTYQTYKINNASQLDSPLSMTPEQHSSDTTLYSYNKPITVHYNPRPIYDSASFETIIYSNQPMPSGSVADWTNEDNVKKIWELRESEEEYMVIVGSMEGDKVFFIDNANMEEGNRKVIKGINEWDEQYLSVEHGTSIDYTVYDIRRLTDLETMTSPSGNGGTDSVFFRPMMMGRDEDIKIYYNTMDIYDANDLSTIIKPKQPKPDEMNEIQWTEEDIKKAWSINNGKKMIISRGNDGTDYVIFMNDSELYVDNGIVTKNSTRITKYAITSQDDLANIANLTPVTETINAGSKIMSSTGNPDVKFSMQNIKENSTSDVNFFNAQPAPEPYINGNVQVLFDVVPKIEMTLTNTTIDFGQLKPFKDNIAESPLNISVKSNMSYSISVLHDGTFKDGNGATHTNADLSISKDNKVNWQQIQPNTDLVVFSNQPVTSGTSYNVYFKLYNVWTNPGSRLNAQLKFKAMQM